MNTLKTIFFWMLASFAMSAAHGQGAAPIYFNQVVASAANFNSTQTTRLLRSGVASQCGVPEVVVPSTTGAGTFLTTGSQFQFTNPFAQGLCFQMEIATLPGCAMSGLYLAAYSPSYNPANPLANVIAQSGLSLILGGPPVPFSAYVPAGAAVVLVASNAASNTSVPACTFTIRAAPAMTTLYESLDVFGGTMPATQTGRLVRIVAAGSTTCATTGVSPGVTNTASSFASTGTRHAFKNTLATPQCVEFTLGVIGSSTCATSALPTLAAYNNSYDPSAPASNLIGASASSNTPPSVSGPYLTAGNPKSFTAVIQPGALVIPVVHEPVAGNPVSYNCQYIVNVSVPVANAELPCSMDVDGDGAISATVDGLLATRAMLGFSGTALTNGITFVGAATRTTAATILPYLKTSCGMTALP